MQSLKIYHISLFLSVIPALLCSQNDGNTVYKILDESFSKGNMALNADTFIPEFENYLLVYPNSNHEDEALFRLSQLYKYKQDVPRQLYVLIKLRFLHDTSPLIPETMNLIDSIFTYKMSLLSSEENDMAIKELGNINKADNYEQAYIDFLSYIHFANIKDLYSPFVRDITHYKTIYKTAQSNLDAISFWQAETYRRMNNIESAIIHFKAVIELYKESVYTAPAMLHLAKLQVICGEKERAERTLIEIVNQFPENPLTGDAQLELAGLYENHFKDYQEAYANYQMFIEAFPNNSQYMEALFKMGDIAILLNDPQKAIDSYKLVIGRSKDQNEILKAYSKILKVQLELLKDLEQAAHTHLLIAQFFPKAPEAASHLLSAAELYCTKLKKKDKFKEILQILDNEYVDSPERQKAKELIYQD